MEGAHLEADMKACKKNLRRTFEDNLFSSVTVFGPVTIILRRAPMGVQCGITFILSSLGTFCASHFSLAFCNESFNDAILEF